MYGGSAAFEGFFRIERGNVGCLWYTRSFRSSIGWSSLSSSSIIGSSTGSSTRSLSFVSYSASS